MRKLYGSGLFASVLLTAHTQLYEPSTGFTYQGRLNNNGSPANGSYDLAFILFSTDTVGTVLAGPVTNTAVGVTNGLFTTLVDFGPNIFNGASNWLQVAVSTNAANSFITLSPRQPVTPTPYALYSTSANAANTAATAGTATNTLYFTNVVADAQLSANIVRLNGANVFGGSNSFSLGLVAPNLIVGPGAAASGEFANALGQYATANGNYSLAMGYGATAGGSYSTALGQGTIAGGNYSFAGGFGNVAAGIASVVAGGGYDGVNFNPGNVNNGIAAFIGSGIYNAIGTNDNYGVIGGGGQNVILPNSPYSFIGGGRGNTNGASYATIVGGFQNAAGGNLATIAGGSGNSAMSYATVAGGYHNSAGGNGAFIGGGGSDGVTVNGGNTNNGPGSVIGGGVRNFVSAAASEAVIGGGNGNTNVASYAAIGGGYQNNTSGNLATIAGGSGNSATNYATVAGGYHNSAGGNGAFIGGGGSDGVTVNGGNTNNGSGSVIGGGVRNYILSSFSWATIGGGYGNMASTYATVGGGYQNTANAAGAVIGGGGYDGQRANQYSFTGNVNYGPGSVIGGGLGNSITLGCCEAAIGSGCSNIVGSRTGYTPPANYATVVGGFGNYASGDGSTAMGQFNTAGGTASVAMGQYSAATNQYCIAMGYASTAGGTAAVAMGQYTAASGDYSLAMGSGSTASGYASLAMGSASYATNFGSFVWSDASAGPGAISASDNSVTMRAAGGYRFFSDPFSTAGVSLPPGGTAWATISDQNAKKNFTAVNGEEILNRLASVPVEKWNYRWEKDSDVPNIGPMAQAFKAAFYPGRDDKSITTLEFDGVELAALQGLNEAWRKEEGRMRKLETENAELKARLEKLEQLLEQK